MDNNLTSNSFDEDNQKSPGMKLVFLGAGFIIICILFITAFIGFQPDQLSLSDRYFPSPTATFTRTPTPTPTPNLTATQQVIRSTATARAIQTSIVNAGSQWDILLSDTFNANENNWEIGLGESERAKINRVIQNGKYQWDATSIKGFIAWIDADTKSLDNFSLTVDVQQTDGSLSSDYGLIFREDANNNFYYFGIDNDSFHLSVSYNDEWIDVIDWTTSSAIRSDGPNRLTVIAEGSHFIFLINDQYVADVTDDHIARGTVALAITLHTVDQQAVFEFDNFELRAP